MWQVWHHHCTVYLHLLYSFDVFAFVVFLQRICICYILSMYLHLLYSFSNLSGIRGFGMEGSHFKIFQEPKSCG